MPAVETDFWQLTIPDEWQVDTDDASVVMADPDGLGSISITTLQFDAEVSGDQALEVAADAGCPQADATWTDLAGADCWYFEFEDDGEYLREWYVPRKDQLLLVSYACDPDDADMDRDMVDEILDGLAYAL